MGGRPLRRAVAFYIEREKFSLAFCSILLYFIHDNSTYICKQEVSEWLKIKQVS